MKEHFITPYIRVLHSDIENHPLFEGFWPIPHGVTLNSYLVKGVKTALIDLTADWQEAIAGFNRQMDSSGSKVDYLILNHLEPDHAGYVAEFSKHNPDLEILTTEKGAALVRNFIKVPESIKVRTVKTGDSLDLGGDIKLDFYEIPNVHWPETMATFEKNSGTLFSCDAFGGFGKTGERIFDDEFTEEEHKFYESESLRYYATIVASFSTFVEKAIAKLTEAGLEIKTIAPSHGIVWRKNPEKILQRYIRYAGYNTGKEQEDEICVLDSTMYGNSRKGLEAVLEGIRAVKGDKYKITILQVPQDDLSVVLATAYKSRGLVISAPTYEYRLFPPTAYILDLFNRKHFYGKKVLRIGSWGWVGGAKKEYEERTQGLKWEQVEQYEWQGVPSEKDLETLREKGKELASLL